MSAVAIAKLSLILRRNEVSGLVQVTRARNKYWQATNEVEANELMKSENKRDQLQVGQTPDFHFRLSRGSELFEFVTNLNVP
jgi:hypothetical protein